MIRFLILALLAPTALLAQDWATRTGDDPFGQAEVAAYISGNTLTFFDDGQSKFSVGGAYSYTYANGGGTAFGSYDIAEDGTVCIAFRNGFSRCDRYVRNGNRVVMLTQKGERFPIR